jgi:hypothetical protein
VPRVQATSGLISQSTDSLDWVIGSFSICDLSYAGLSRDKRNSPGCSVIDRRFCSCRDFFIGSLICVFWFMSFCGGSRVRWSSLDTIDCQRCLLRCVSFCAGVPSNWRLFVCFWSRELLKLVALLLIHREQFNNDCFRAWRQLFRIKYMTAWLCLCLCLDRTIAVAYMW